MSGIKRRRLKKWLDLDIEECAWIDKHYPGISYSALVTMLLTKFREAHHIVPADLAEIGARELKKALEA